MFERKRVGGGTSDGKAELPRGAPRIPLNVFNGRIQRFIEAEGAMRRVRDLKV